MRRNGLVYSVILVSLSIAATGLPVAAASDFPMPVECAGQTFQASDRRANKDEIIIYKETGYFPSMSHNYPDNVSHIEYVDGTSVIRKRIEDQNADVILSKSLILCEDLISLGNSLTQDAYKAYFLEVIDTHDIYVRIGILSKFDLVTDIMSFDVSKTSGSDMPECGLGYFIQLKLPEEPITISEWHLSRTFFGSDQACDSIENQMTDLAAFNDSLGFATEHLIILDIDSWDHSSWARLSKPEGRRELIDRFLTGRLQSELATSEDETNNLSSFQGPKLLWQRGSFLAPLLKSSDSTYQVNSVDYTFDLLSEFNDSFEVQLNDLTGVRIVLSQKRSGEMPIATVLVGILALTALFVLVLRR